MQSMSNALECMCHHLFLKAMTQILAKCQNDLHAGQSKSRSPYTVYKNHSKSPIFLQFSDDFACLYARFARNVVKWVKSKRVIFKHCVIAIQPHPDFHFVIVRARAPTLLLLLGELAHIRTFPFIFLITGARLSEMAKSSISPPSRSRLNHDFLFASPQIDNCLSVSTNVCFLACTLNRLLIHLRCCCL